MMQSNKHIVCSDQALWKFPMTDSQRHDILQSGPTQPLKNSDEEYPKYENHRHFSNFYFTRKLNNGDIQHRRRCLVYPKSQNKVFCFPCRLFGNSHINSNVASWKKLLQAKGRPRISFTEDNIERIMQPIREDPRLSTARSSVLHLSRRSLNLVLKLHYFFLGVDRVEYTLNFALLVIY